MEQQARAFWWPLVKGGVVFLGSLFAMIAAMYGALYLLIPSLEPREKLGSAIESIGVAQEVSYSQYATNEGNFTRNPDDPRDLGIEILVSANLRAFKDRSYSMHVQLMEPKTFKLIYPGADKPLDPLAEGRTISRCQNKSPRADEDLVTWRCWSIAPEPGTEYFVRTTLNDSGMSSELKDGRRQLNYELLAFRDSEIFKVPQ